MITENKFYEYLDEHSKTNKSASSAAYDRDDYLAFHKKRYWKSYEFIEPYLKKGISILELGEPGPFTYVINQCHPEIKTDFASEDLRYQLSFPSNTYDIILNMEVIEHIKDQKDAEMTFVDFSGLKMFIQECLRVLKPGGVMFISTPNSLSYNNMNLFFNHEASWMWYHHFREFCTKDLSIFLKEGGFQIPKIITLNVWPQRNEHRYTKIIQLLDKTKRLLGLKSEKEFLRGDSIFLICQKAEKSN